jgi:hypothetical protein
MSGLAEPLGLPLQARGGASPTHQLRLEVRAEREFMTPQQCIESLLQRFLVAAFAAQGPQEFRAHLLEGSGVVGYPRAE